MMPFCPFLKKINKTYDKRTLFYQHFYNIYVYILQLYKIIILGWVGMGGLWGVVGRGPGPRPPLSMIPPTSA